MSEIYWKSVNWIGKLPQEWREVSPPLGPLPGKWAQRWFVRKDGLLAGVDCEVKTDGRFWIHVSTSFSDKLPGYEDLAEIKRLFIGEDRKAIQVFPPKSTHVNIHTNCLHLWAPYGDDPLPEFSGFIGGVRSI